MGLHAKMALHKRDGGFRKCHIGTLRQRMVKAGFVRLIYVVQSIDGGITV